MPRTNHPVLGTLGLIGLVGFALAGCQSVNDVSVTNASSRAVHLDAQTANGFRLDFPVTPEVTQSFRLKENTPIRINDAVVTIERSRLTVSNTGERTIDVRYVNDEGETWTTRLGQGGTGYFHEQSRIDIDGVVFEVAE